MHRHKTCRHMGKSCIRGTSRRGVRSSTHSPPLTLRFLDTVLQYTTAAAHRSLLSFELMSSTPPPAGLSLPLTEFNFLGADFCDFGGDFGASFGFDADFGAVFGNFPDFFGGSITSDFEGDSCGSSSDDMSGHRR